MSRRGSRGSDDRRRSLLGRRCLAQPEGLEPRLALAVSVIDPVPDLAVETTAARQYLPLAGRFDDTAVTGTVVRFGTNANSPFDQFFVELFDAEGPGRSRTTPVTAANFLRYVDAGRYANTFIHRSAPGFVIQSGGYALAPGLPHIETFEPIVNEFGTSNTRGTIAMAKVDAAAPGGGPDSATSEWFVNLVDNSANLDGQNGGFTVFGRVLGSGLALFDAIAAELPRYDIRATFNNAALDTTPLLGIPNPVPADFQLSAANFLHFPAVERVGELVLTVSSSDPALVAPSFLTSSQGPQLQLDLSSGRAGTAVVTLRIASTFDPQDFVEDPFTVVITPPPSPPSDILLSAASVAENLPPGTVVGGVSSVDPNAGDTFTYSLVAGAGDADNASFTIVGNELRTAARFNSETKSAASIRVRSTDQGGLSMEKVFAIAVTDVAAEPLVIESLTPPAAGSYRAGEIMTFVANLSEVATVNGKPQLEFRLGSAVRRATYVAGGGTPRLTFQYKVAPADNAEQVFLGSKLVVSAKNAIVAGVESLAALLPTALANTLFGGVRLDTVAPKALGGIGVPAPGSYAPGQALNFVVTFSENVFVDGAALPTIALSGLAGGPRQAVYVSGSGTNRLTFRYVVRSGDTPAGTKGLALGKAITVNGGRITDRDGKNMAAVKIPSANLRLIRVVAKDSPVNGTSAGVARLMSGS